MIDTFEIRSLSKLDLDQLGKVDGSPYLTELFKHIGYNQLIRYKQVALWRGVEFKLELVGKLLVRLTDWFDHNENSIDLHQYSKFWECYLCLELHQQWLRMVSTQLDIYNTMSSPLPCSSVDLCSEDGGYDDWYRLGFGFKPNETVWNNWRLYIKKYSIDAIYSICKGFVEKPKGVVDLASRMLVMATYAQRHSVMRQRLLYEFQKRSDMGWFIVFNTLTLSEDYKKSFFDDKRALTKHFVDVGKSVLRAEGRKLSENSSDCFSYFCVPEFGSKNGRLHFHCVYFMRTLPAGSEDPTKGGLYRNRVQLDSLRSHWSYGFSMPIPLRFQGDAFTRLGWLQPLDLNGKVRDVKPPCAIAFYIMKYVSKCMNIQMYDNETLRPGKDKILCVNQSMKAMFRVRMSRHLGRMESSMEEISLESLIEMTKLDLTVTEYPKVIQVKARRELLTRASVGSVRDLQVLKSAPEHLLKSLRCILKTTQAFNHVSFMSMLTKRLGVEDISDETKVFLQEHKMYLPSVRKVKAEFICGVK